MVTVLEATPPMLIATTTSEPFVGAAGTKAFTWYVPTKPGARPENRTVACAPPIVTLGMVVVIDKGLFDEDEPVAGWFVTAPRPVQ